MSLSWECLHSTQRIRKKCLIKSWMETLMCKVTHEYLICQTLVMSVETLYLGCLTRIHRQDSVSMGLKSWKVILISMLKAWLLKSTGKLLNLSMFHHHQPWSHHQTRTTKSWSNNHQTQLRLRSKLHHSAKHSKTSTTYKKSIRVYSIHTWKRWTYKFHKWHVTTLSLSMRGVNHVSKLLMRKRRCHETYNTIKVTLDEWTP